MDRDECDRKLRELRVQYGVLACQGRVREKKVLLKESERETIK